jgi:predicted unusual protein kinase regulating ubiquinone biosynthesis (AarF/ABC1/UbiB family)
MTTEAPLAQAPPSARRGGRPLSQPYRAHGVSSWRFVRAYVTTFRVIASYSLFRVEARLRGPAFRALRLGVVHKENAQLVYRTILTLQGLFIKVGQLLSILANFLPEEFRNELEGLQDQVPPRPFDEAHARIISELGEERTRAFVFIDQVPIASASLGQVHEARLADGRRVVVKVQHQSVDTIVRIDLKIIRNILRIVRFFFPIEGLDSYYHQVKELLEQELDFRQEADSIERIASNFRNDKRVVFPMPVRELSSQRVLTTEFVEGVKVNDVAALDAMGIDRTDVAKRLVRAYCQMIFVDGVYHADPHPGNILVQQDGAIVLLDFGAVAQLSPGMREGIPDFLVGVLRRDTQKLVLAMRKMGFLSRTMDEQVTERIIEYFHKRFQEEVRLDSFNLKDIKLDPQRGFENLLDLRKMNIGLRELTGAFHIPKDWVLLERTLLLLYGCCAQLDPVLKPIAIVQPYVQDFVLQGQDWTQVILASVREATLSAVTLPDDLRKYLTRAMRGQLEVKVKGVDEAAGAVRSSARQLVYTAIGLFSVYEGFELRKQGDPQAMRWCFVAAGVCGVLLLGSFWWSRPKRS